MEAVVGGFLLLWIVICVLAIAATIFWVWMLVDVLTSKRETNEKILWFLVVFLLHLLGAVIYFIVGRQRSGSAAAAAT